MSDLQEQKSNSFSYINYNKEPSDLDKIVLGARFELACNTMLHKSFSDYLNNSNGEKEILHKILKHPLYHHLRIFISYDANFATELLDYIEAFSEANFGNDQKYFEAADCSIFVMLAVINNSKYKDRLKDLLNSVIKSNNVFWSKRYAKVIRSSFIS